MFFVYGNTKPHFKTTCIIEVSFELYGAEDRQSVAQGVCFTEDLMIERHLSCHTNTQNNIFLKKWSLDSVFKI